MDVGVRQLRDELSRHLAEVRDGATITVTDHGRPIGYFDTSAFVPLLVTEPSSPSC